MLTFLIVWLLGAALATYIILKLGLEQVEYITLGYATAAVVVSLLFGPMATVVAVIVYSTVSGKADRFFSRIIIDRRENDTK